jgi:hypothetical protein
MSIRPYALGFLVAGLAWSAIMLIVSLFAWQAKACIEWGLIVTMCGFGVKWLAEKM